MKNQMTETIAVTVARQTLPSLLNRVYRERTRILVEKSGIPVAALIPLADLERLEQFDQERAESLALLDSMRAPFRTTPADEIEREVERALAEVREELRIRPAPLARAESGPVVRIE